MLKCLNDCHPHGRPELSFQALGFGLALSGMPQAFWAVNQQVKDLGLLLLPFKIKEITWVQTAFCNILVFMIIDVKLSALSLPPVQHRCWVFMQTLLPRISSYFFLQTPYF